MEQLNNRILPYALKKGEGWTYRFGIDFTVKASEVQEGSGAAFMEYVTRKGEEPPSHTHRTEDEMFYVLEGSITFQCGEKTFDLEQGGFIFLPRGIRHSYTIHSEEPVRLIVVTSPVREGSSRGWGGYVSDLESGQGELIANPGMQAKLMKVMNRDTAEALIRQYFQSWLQQDLSLFLSTLSPNIQVVECYGPVYWGTEEVGHWFVDWHRQSGKGKVTKWEIFKILYDEAQNMAAVEWDFECIYAGNVGSFLGASLFHFDETRIQRIQEYKMEKEQYRPYGNQPKV